MGLATPVVEAFEDDLVANLVGDTDSPGRHHFVRPRERAPHLDPAGRPQDGGVHKLPALVVEDGGGVFAHEAADPTGGSRLPDHRGTGLVTEDPQAFGFPTSRAILTAALVVLPTIAATFRAAMAGFPQTNLLAAVTTVT